MNRREFLTCAAAGAAMATVPNAGFAAAKAAKLKRPEGFLWADLLHFGMNMWGDWDRESETAPEDQFKKQKAKKPKVQKPKARRPKRPRRKKRKISR